MTIDYVTRKLTVVLTLGKGNFGDDPAGTANTGTFEGLRCEADITLAGAPCASTAVIRVWGLTESTMNQFSSLGRPIFRERNNTVTLLAGDDTNGMAQVYTGLIKDAYQSFSDDGAAAFEILTMPNLIARTKPVNPLSYPNGADAGTVMSGIANLMNRRFQNNGVSVQLPPGSYFWGAAAAMAESVRKAGNFLMYDDGVTLSIYPRDGTPSGQIPDIGPTSGLVGYPELSGYGVKLKTLFNPKVVVFGWINLDTSLTSARGQWQIMDISHQLSSIVPGGPWFTYLDCRRGPVST